MNKFLKYLPDKSPNVKNVQLRFGTNAVVTRPMVSTREPTIIDTLQLNRLIKTPVNGPERTIIVHKTY